MNVLLVVSVIFLVLALFAYISKRRFGVLAFGVLAGTFLTTSWTDSLTPIIQAYGSSLEEYVSPTAFVAFVVTLFPVLLLAFAGPKQNGRIERMLCAIFFGLLTIAALLEPLSSTLVLKDQSKDLFETLMNYQPFIVTVSLLFAIVDFMTSQRKKSHDSDKH